MKRRRGEAASQPSFYFQPQNQPADIDEVEFLQRFQATIEINRPEPTPCVIIHRNRTHLETLVETPAVSSAPEAPKPKLIDIVNPQPRTAPAFFARTTTPRQTLNATSGRIRRPRGRKVQ